MELTANMVLETSDGQQKPVTKLRIGDMVCSTGGMLEIMDIRFDGKVYRLVTFPQGMVYASGQIVSTFSQDDFN